MRFVAKVAVTFLFVPFLAAQQQPTFRSHAELVVVPTVVADHSGAHIHGLKKEDFIVRENGVAQKISMFEEVFTSSQPIHKVELRPGLYSNYVTGEVAPRRITIIAFDLLNTPFEDQAHARSQLLKFVKTIADTSEPIALLTITRSGVHMIHDFTTDPSVLFKAIQRLQGQQQIVDAPNGEAGPDETEIAAEMSSMQSLQSEGDANFVQFQQQFSAQLTIQALQQIASTFGGIPGRKSLIWASSGFPFNVSDSLMAPTLGRSSATDMMPLYERTWAMLNDSPIAVYPIDLGGLRPLLPGADIRRPASNYRSLVMSNNLAVINTFKQVAEATGGRAFYNTNDIAGAVRKAADDSSSYYVIAYYRPPNDTKPGWRKLKVSVQRPGVEVRARSGFFVRTAAAESKDEAQREVWIALNSPVDYTSIPFTAELKQQQPGSTGKAQVPFQLVLAANSVAIDADDNNHMKVDVIAFVKNDEGMVLKQTGHVVDGHLKREDLDLEEKHGTTYTDQMELPPGKYRVRFVVRDELSGRMGTVTAPLDVR